MTSWILARHGQTDWNLAGRFQGQSDPPLNATGEHQAYSLSAALASTHIDAIFTSDLLRARRTAEIVAFSKNLPVFVVPCLREVNLGVWEGLLVSDIQTIYPAEWAGRQQDPLHSRPPGGESLLDVAQRVEACFAAIRAEFPRQTVLVISHGLALATQICRFLRMPLDSAYSRIPDNGVPVFMND